MRLAADDMVSSAHSSGASHADEGVRAASDPIGVASIVKPDQLTTSAALFGNPSPQQPIPLAWFERALSFFQEFGLTPIFFTAGGGEFLLDDCYVLAPPGNDLVKWGEPIPARHDALLEALQGGTIDHLGLDCPREGSADRSEWRGDASASTHFGDYYLGIDEERISDPVEVLRRALSMVHDLFDVRYGFAYKMPLADLPDCYASGIGRTTLADVKAMLWRHIVPLPPKSRDELWQDEVYGERRHLTGLFRGAYPANLLSEAHVNRADLQAAGLGKLTEIGGDLWLWEFADDELPQAEDLLAAKQLLVSQARQA